MVGLFGKHTGICPAQQKCVTYSVTREHGRTAADMNNLHIDNVIIPNLHLGETFKYLGTPIGSRKTARIEGSEAQLEKMLRLVTRLGRSGLKFSQKLHALRSFAIPMMDFLLTNGQIRSTSLERADQKIRTILNEHCKGVHLPIELFYTDWKDGGLGLASLHERQHILKLSLLATLQCSSDRDTVGWSSSSLEKYAERRRFPTDRGEQEFLNWFVDRNNPVRAAGHDSLAGQAHIAATKLSVGFNIGSLGKTVVIRDMKTSYRAELSPKEVSRTITRILQGRHREGLHKLPCRGHAFPSQKDSPLSNFFLGNHTAPTSDALVRFAIKGRTDNLPTASNLKKADPSRTDRCSSCGKVETLNHRLNGCQSKKAGYTPRHNAVVELVASLAEKHTQGSIIMNRSTTIKLNGVSLPERSKSLKPDLWFVKPSGEITIVEVTIPYAQ